MFSFFQVKQRVSSCSFTWFPLKYLTQDGSQRKCCPERAAAVQRGQGEGQERVHRPCWEEPALGWPLHVLFPESRPLPGPQVEETLELTCYSGFQELTIWDETDKKQNYYFLLFSVIGTSKTLCTLGIKVLWADAFFSVLGCLIL